MNNQLDIHQVKKAKVFSPTRRIAISFLGVIILGAFLLSLPFAHQDQTTSFLNHLFVATSATCVTGLTPITIAQQYNIIGQIVIMLLIQIGGLGFLTLLYMMIIAFQHKLAYSSKIIMQEALNQHSVRDIEIYMKQVITYTLWIEILGTCLLSLVFVPKFGIVKGVYYAFFHAVSAFCNAGFDILGSQSLIAYQTDLFVNLVIGGLVIAGGIGFVVWIDLRMSWQKYQERFLIFRFKTYISSLSLHTKLVLVMTIFLLLSGSFFFLLLEWNNPQTIGLLSWPQKILVSFFQSITLRTAGFTSINQAAMHVSTKLLCCIYMFIGGSPAGTAGGIKTVTFALVLLSMASLIQGRSTVNVMNRSIDEQVIKRCFIMTFVSFFICLCALFVLTISENQAFIDLLFEVLSAFATVGLTADVTSSLSVIGQFVVMILMYIGRIGPMTMIVLFIKRYYHMKGKDIHYPFEHVLIG